jgi:hypothetical protein
MQTFFIYRDIQEEDLNLCQYYQESTLIDGLGRCFFSNRSMEEELVPKTLEVTKLVLLLSILLLPISKLYLFDNNRQFELLLKMAVLQIGLLLQHANMLNLHLSIFYFL